MAYANYSFIDATYRFSGTIASPNNPMADANGDIFVVPATRSRRFRRISSRPVSSRGDAGMEGRRRRGGGGQPVFRRRQQQSERQGAGLLDTNLHTSYQLTKEAQVFGLSPTCSTSATIRMAHISSWTASRKRCRSRSPIRAP
jgi:iron complex outermembrane receptor protein